MRFKTNLHCGGCLQAVTPGLNQLLGEGNWNIDLTTPEKLLEVYVDTIAENEVVEVLEKADYKAAKITPNP